MNIMENILLLVRFSWRNIWRQKKRSMVIMSSAAAGMVGILFTMGLTNGFMAVMIDTALKSGLGHVQVRPQGYSDSRKISLKLEDPAAIAKKLEGYKNINYSFRLEKEGILKAGNVAQGVNFIGVDPETEKGISSFHKWIEAGSFLSGEPSENELIIPCVIGYSNAVKMVLEPEDYVVISVTREDGTLYSIRGVVKGIYHSASDPLDRHVVLLNRRDLSRIISTGTDSASYVTFFGKNMDMAGTYKEEIQKQLAGTGNVEVMSFSDLEPTITRLFDMMDQLYWIIYVIIFFGYAFILFESVSMSVFERMREIGIMSAIGSGPFILFGMIMFESILLTVMGSLGGSLLSQLIVWYYQFNGLSLEAFAKGMESWGGAGSTIFPYLNIRDIANGVYFAAIIAFFSAIYPAFKAVKISPIKAIYNR